MKPQRQYSECVSTHAPQWVVTLGWQVRAFFWPAHSCGCDDIPYTAIMVMMASSQISKPGLRRLGYSLQPLKPLIPLYDTISSIQGTGSTEIAPTADRILPWSDSRTLLWTLTAQGEQSKVCMNSDLRPSWLMLQASQKRPLKETLDYL